MQEIIAIIWQRAHPCNSPPPPLRVGDNFSETTSFYGGQPPVESKKPRTRREEKVVFQVVGSSKFFVEDSALRTTTNPGAAKNRRCRSSGDLPPPGLRLPPSRDALRRTSRLADGGASPPPIRASSPRRGTNAAFAAHESTQIPILTESPKSMQSRECGAHLHFSPVRFEIENNQNNFFFSPRTGPCGTTLSTAFGSDLRSVGTLRSSRFALTQPDRFATGVFLRAFLSRRAVARRKMKLFQIVVSNQQRSANSPCRTFCEVSCAAKAAFRVRRHGETRRGGGDFAAVESSFVFHAQRG